MGGLEAPGLSKHPPALHCDVVDRAAHRLYHAGGLQTLDGGLVAVEPRKESGTLSGRHQVQLRPCSKRALIAAVGLDVDTPRGP
jgi:hypothetical protein